MTTENGWPEIQAIFNSALELPPGERAGFLDTRCADRPAVRAEVESLLASYVEADGFLDTTAIADGGQLAGLRVGAFRLVREIGRGGMSVVYLGERVDGDFTQEVAVKVLDAPLRHVDTLQRFRAERQILASFAHPHIVSLLDGGVTADGHAYLVMELVDGEPLTRYCAARRLGLEERLALMQRVCAAVQYAHQHGVVHRDLKPANILVTPDGVVKVLDFGVAKLLDTAPGAANNATIAAGLRPLTPNYASPEQLRGLPVTTASDIYALGVLAYEVVAGARPYDLSNQTLDVMLKIVTEVDPARPSVAAARAEALPYDSHRLRGDLDAIVLKAMSKEPTERYGSAQQLAADLTRHANSEPVEARPPSVGYVLARLARRHRAAFAAAAVSLVALVAALSVSLWQTRRAVAERRRADQRFGEIRQLANALIFKIHDGIAPLPGSTPVRRMIVAEALTYLERLSRDPAGDDALRLDLARGYHRVGDVQGKPSAPNLGDREGALASYRNALALIRPARSRPLAAEAATELVQLDIALANVLSLNRATDEARGALAEAVETAARLVRSDPSDAARRLLGSAYFQAAVNADPANALVEWTKAGAVFQALLDERPEDPDRQRNVALVEKYVGTHYEGDNEYERALPHYVRALELDEKRLAAAPSNRSAQFDVSVDLSSVAFSRHVTGHPAEAIPDFERCLRIREELSASDPKDVQVKRQLKVVHDRLGRLFIDLGRVSDALDHHRKAVAIAESMATIDVNAKFDLADSLFALAVAEALDGRMAVACDAYLRSFAIADGLLRSESLSPSLERNVRRRAATTGERLVGCKKPALR
jgi:non-specific serine/threonine protein kinase/serine/threonine-protein kinase